MAKIGILILDKMTDRGTIKRKFFDALDYIGFRRIIKEVSKKHDVEYCWPGNIGNYDFVLCSLTSLFDVENLIYSFEKYKSIKNNVKIIVGGAGCTNIKIYSEYIDIAVFGRAENQICNIIDGKNYDNVWRKEDDIDFKKIYQFRQAQESIENEGETVGCLNKCYFCQYSWSHKPFNYTNKLSYLSTLNKSGHEDDWRNLDIQSGRSYITALDGMSENTRRIINKPITDDDIRKKIIELYEKDIKTRISLKIFNIVGYPWETPESVVNDLEKLKCILKDCDCCEKKMDLKLFFLFTPFSPEPLTPMQYCPANIDINWRELLLKNYKLYTGTNIEAYIMHYINTPFTLLKRLIINRGYKDDLTLLKQMLFTNRLKKMRGNQATKIIKEKLNLPEYIHKKINYNTASFNYLQTYVDVYKIAGEFEEIICNHENNKDKDCRLGDYTL